MQPDTKDQSLQTPGVLDKYQAAGKIANVLAQCVVGKQVVDICKKGDKLIEDQVSKIYNKKRLDKGIAFHTSVSPNHLCGHVSPLPEDKIVISEGDLVKVVLGVQIDGFVAMAAHSIYVNSDSKKINQGKKADVVLACYKAMEASLRLMRPGKKNSDVTKLMNKVAQDFGVNTVQGVLSHEVKKYLIDGNDCISSKDNYQQKVDQFQFQQNQVFVLDFIFSTGSGKPKQADMRCTVYKRAIERSFILKSKQGRAFFNQLNGRFPALPFTIRAFEDQVSTKLGIKQCLQHQLLTSYPVLTQKVGQLVAQFTCTVAILKSQTMVLSGLPLQQTLFKSQKTINDKEILQLLSQPILKKQKKK